MRTRKRIATLTLRALGMFVPLTLLVACSRLPPSAPSMSAASGSPTEVWIPSNGILLRGFVYRPEGAGPFPTVVYNHGSERDPSLKFLGDLGTWFQSHGFVLLLPFRRGSGGSPGTYWRDAVAGAEGEANQMATIAQLEKENDDVVSAVTWARAQPYVDGSRIAVSGCSFGGIHTLLAAQRPIGLYAAVDFAGACRGPRAPRCRGASSTQWIAPLCPSFSSKPRTTSTPHPPRSSRRRCKPQASPIARAFSHRTEQPTWRGMPTSVTTGWRNGGRRC